jgi:3-hydroxyisobutyrate dehydrogenase-like beta-hydroxyacid dehydrogenase
MQRITSGQFDTDVGAEATIGIKDVGMMRAQAEKVSCALPLADLHAQHLRTLRSQGREGWDWASVAQVIAEQSGTTLMEASASQPPHAKHGK